MSSTLLAGLLFTLPLAALVLGTIRYRRNSADSRALFIAIVLAGLAIRLVFVFGTPIFYAPDEQSHFNYLNHLASEHTFPVVKGMLGDPENLWENHQSPLYYLLLLPVYLAAKAAFSSVSTIIIVLRLCSVLLWLANTWLAWIILQRLEIVDAFTRLFAVSMLCLLPTFTFVSSAVNNDNLIIPIGTVLLYLMTLRDYSVRTSLLLSLVLGLGLWTKQSALIFVPGLGVMALMEALRRTISWRTAALHLALVFGLAAILYLPWALRNWQLYHTLTPENLVTLRLPWPSTAYGIASAAHNVTKSFWAVSGISNDIGYPFPLIGMAFLLLCCAWYQQGLKDWQLESLKFSRNGPLLIAWFLGVLISVGLAMRFSYLFGTGQGRHVFPFLVPIALLLAARARAFAVKHLDVLCVAGWMIYAMAFTLFSLNRFP